MNPSVRSFSEEKWTGPIRARPAGVRILRCLLPSVALLFTLSACGGDRAEKALPDGRIVTARVETLRLTPLPVYAVFPGTVVSVDRVDISSRLSGYVHGLALHEGQTVTKGELLLTVDPAGVEAQIDQAQGELAKAVAMLRNARANYRRYKNLYGEQASTAQEFLQKETEYEVASGAHESAKAALANTLNQLKYAEVRAPFDGLIVSKLVDNGQLATPGTPLLVVEDPSHLQVRVAVDERSFAHLKIGQEIQIQLTGPAFEMVAVMGTVERMVAAADPVTHTHMVKIGLPAGSEASSGEYALVRVPVGTHEGIVVLDESIHVRAGITGAFVIDEAGKAQFRMVSLGELLPQGRLVLSGLFPGDRIIVAAEEPLANGMSLRIEAENGA